MFEITTDPMTEPLADELRAEKEQIEREERELRRRSTAYIKAKAARRPKPSGNWGRLKAPLPQRLHKYITRTRQLHSRSKRWAFASIARLDPDPGPACLWEHLPEDAQENICRTDWYIHDYEAGEYKELPTWWHEATKAELFGLRCANRIEERSARGSYELRLLERFALSFRAFYEDVSTATMWADPKKNAEPAAPAPAQLDPSGRRLCARPRPALDAGALRPRPAPAGVSAR
jgi:hypothetical protein